MKYTMRRLFSRGRRLGRAALALTAGIAASAVAVVLPAGTAFAGEAWNTPGALAAGMGHTLLVTKPDATGWNEVYAAGSNDHGELGNNTTVDSTVFVKVSNLSHVKSVAAGARYSVAVKQDGTVWTWGANNNGQLGLGHTSERKIPTQVPGITNAVSASANETGTVLVVLADGTVRAWGGNTGNCASSTTPVTVSGLTGVATTQGAVASAYGFALAVLADGTVRAWGSNTSGQLGNGTTTASCSPIAVPGLTGVSQVSAKGFHSLARLSNGTVRAWGANNLGQLGDGTTTNRLSPVTVPGLSDVAQVSAGYYHSTAVTNGSAAAIDRYTWGGGVYGQLGHGNNANVSSPTLVLGGVEGTVMEAGAYHTISLFDSAAIPEAWGRNDGGQLGIGNTTSQNTPASVLVTW
ncbi:MAG TPA: hypothetical protein VHJ17_16700 [Thermomonospora sp.]|nr:hypothetical protein [Thermomonospora sp.]